MSTIRVISEKGKLVGTFLPQPPSRDPKAPVCAPIVRKGQKLHEIEVPNAERYYEQRKTADLHKLVMKKLKLK